MIAVAGFGPGSAKSTAAVNLAVAFAASGLDVELRDFDPAGASTRALGCAPNAGEGVAREVLLSRRLKGRVTVVAGADGYRHDRPAAERTGPGAVLDVVIVDCPPGWGGAASATNCGARVVLVPVDASAVALQGLAEIADALARQPDSSRATPAARLRVALERLVPRHVDRWAVLDRLTESYPGALCATTIPAGRRGASADRAARPATLYAPTSRAAAAYAALARELSADLSL